MRLSFITAMFCALAGPLVAQDVSVTNDLTVTIAPQRYRICNDRPARPMWMDSLNPREAYKALTLMDLYELRAWEEIAATGDCSCETRFPAWDRAEEEYVEQYGDIPASDHTAAQRDIRQQRNSIRHAVQAICETEGNW